MSEPIIEERKLEELVRLTCKTFAQAKGLRDEGNTPGALLALDQSWRYSVRLNRELKKLRAQIRNVKSDVLEGV